MPKKKQVAEEDLIIPPQDGRICGTICICQMTLVLSCVAIVYLTVAVYMPASKAFSSGIIETPVMCTTTRAVIQESCEKTTCGEWCLSKGAGACQHVFVHLRKNGTSLLFGNCTNTANKTCYGLNIETAKNFTCIRDECKNLTGIFNCSLGVCHNITDAFECEFHNVDPVIKCSGRRGKVTCMEIHGMFNCNRGACEKIRAPYNCERRCLDIPTRNKNVIVLSGDTVFLSKCASAYNYTANSTSAATEVWSESDTNQTNIMMASCHHVKNTPEGVIATDCVNGSVLTNRVLGDFTNFTFLSYLHYAEANFISEIAPLETDLTISNDSLLMINLEGCVNTLKDECRDFFRHFAKDGSDHNARARFPCFYSEKDVKIAVARFDLDIEYKQFAFAFYLPTVLLVVSCFTLVLCQRAIVVGDDSKMRFRCFTNEDTGKLNVGGLNGYEEAL